MGSEGPRTGADGLMKLCCAAYPSSGEVCSAKGCHDDGRTAKTRKPTSQEDEAFRSGELETATGSRLLEAV